MDAVDLCPCHGVPWLKTVGGRRCRIKQYAHDAAHGKKKRARRIAEDRCVVCGQPRGESRGVVKCERCLDNQSIAHADKQIARYQEELREKSD